MKKFSKIQQLFCLKFLIIPLVFLIFLNNITFAQVVLFASGTVTNDTTWNADTIKITDNITVPLGVTLTISPGTYIEFQGYYGFTINGRLMAIGNTGDSITFSIADTSGFSDLNISNGGWKGIAITNTESHIEYCNINHIKRPKSDVVLNKSGIEVYNKNMVISNNNFNNNITEAATIRAIYNADSCLITNNIFTKNTGYKNSYTNGAVLDLYYSNGHLVKSNHFFDNYNLSGTDFKFIISVSYSTNNTFTENLIENNFGVFFIGAVTGTFTNNIVKNNNSLTSSRIIYIDWNSSISFINNAFYNNNGSIGINGCKPLFMGNIFANNDGGINSSGGGGSFINNTIVNNSSGFSFFGKSLPKLINNILWNNNSGNSQIYIDGYSDPKIYNCNIQNDSTGISFGANGYFPSVYKNVIDIDPGFVNPPGNDWTLNTTSLCINAGTNIPESTTYNKDINGNNRVCHGLPDIGACEISINKIDACGNIASNTNWIADTVNLNCDVTVNAGVQLSIAPGTKVISRGKYFLTVYGAIHAIGDESHPIIFTKPDSTSFFANQDSCWTGIRFQSTNDTSILKYCTIQYADHGFNISSSYNIYIDYCNIQYNNLAFSVSNSKLAVTNTLIYKNIRKFPSIYLGVSDALFENCKVYNNTIWQINNQDNLIISNCILANNGTFDFGTSDFKILNSTFVNNLSTRFGYSNPDIYNTIFYSTSNIEFYGINCNPKFTNCLYRPGHIYTGTNNIYGNPFFINATNGEGVSFDALNADFRITALSPAINAGTTNVVDLSIPALDAVGNQRINANLIDIGAYENQGSKLEFTQQPAGGIYCSGSSVTLSVAVSDSSYFQWQKDGQSIVGANSSTYIIENVNENNQGNYVCIANNSYGNSYSNPVLVLIKTMPEITEQPIGGLVVKSEPCKLDVRAEGNRPLRYQWLKDGDILSSDTLYRLKIDSFIQSDEATYTCKVSNVCGEVYSEIVTLSLAPQICMVTVDPETGQNQVVWEKESKIKYKQFNIYREGTVAGYYEPIGTVPYNETSVFTDVNVNPKEQAYLYKITATDSSNVETDIDLCKPHKTIHLLVTEGVPDGYQLDWDEYIGFTYSTYKIYRKIASGKFEPVHEMASTTRTWTDFDAPNDTLYYYVAVENANGCDPSTNTKAGGGIYSESISNMEDNRLRLVDGIANNNVPTIYFTNYPNPYKGETLITYKLNSTSEVSLEVFDLLGKKVVTLVNTTQTVGEHKYKFSAQKLGFSSGLYIAKLTTENSTSIISLVEVK